MRVFSSSLAWTSRVQIADSARLYPPHDSRPFIEIAADGKSARSHWLSQGATGSNTSAGWVWGPYYVDYIKENGEWRILHSNLAPTVRTSSDVSWAEATDNGTVRGVLGVEPDAPPECREVPRDATQQWRCALARNYLA